MILSLGQSQLGTFYGCSNQECDSQKNFAKCELKGNYWTSVEYVNKKLCTCCQTERAAQFGTGKYSSVAIIFLWLFLSLFIIFTDVLF